MAAPRSFLGSRQGKVSFWHLCTEANDVQFGLSGVRLLGFSQGSREVGWRGAGHSFGDCVRPVAAPFKKDRNGACPTVSDFPYIRMGRFRAPDHLMRFLEAL